MTSLSDDSGFLLSVFSRPSHCWRQAQKTPSSDPSLPVGWERREPTPQYGQCWPSALRVSCCLNPASTPSDATGFNSTGGSRQPPSASHLSWEDPQQVCPAPSLESGGHNLPQHPWPPLWPGQLRGSSEFPKGDVALLSSALQIWLTEKNGLWVSWEWIWSQRRLLSGVLSCLIPISCCGPEYLP